jgi:RNA polymerase sigma-70 factor, ECF subfamily
MVERGPEWAPILVGKSSDKEQLPEELLIQRARAGDPDAFDTLFLLHKDGIYACLWHLLGGNADEVEEAVGTVFLQAYRGLQKFRGGASLATWLYRIAINESHARRRKLKRCPSGGSALREETLIAAGRTAPDPAYEVLRDDETRRLWRAVHALPEPYRSPLLLRYAAGLDSPEIAGVLGRPAGTVRYQLGRALAILRERLGSE